MKKRDRSRRKFSWTGPSFIDVALGMAHSPMDSRRRDGTRSERGWAAFGAALLGSGVVLALYSISPTAPGAVASPPGLVAGLIVAVLGASMSLGFASNQTFSRISRFFGATAGVVSSALALLAFASAAVSLTVVVFFPLVVHRPVTSSAGAVALMIISWALAMALILFAFDIAPPLLSVNAARAQGRRIRRNAAFAVFVVIVGVAGAVSILAPMSPDYLVGLLAVLLSAVPLVSALAEGRRVRVTQREILRALTAALGAAETAERLRTPEAHSALVVRLYEAEDALRGDSPKFWRIASPELVAMLGFARSRLGRTSPPRVIEQFSSHVDLFSQMTTGQCLVATSEYLRNLRARNY